MKKLLYFFLLITISLFNSCRKGEHVINPALLLADSLMQSRPDSSLYLLEQISDPQKIKNADRAFYNLLLTQAKYKNCILLQNDSSIQIAVDYYKKNVDKERLAKSYFYLGCVYLEQKKLPTAIDFYLKAIDVMPKDRDSIFLSMIYSHLGDSYNKQNLNQTAISMYKKGYYLCMKYDSVRTCYFLKDIGDAFLLKYQLDSTYYYYQQALVIAHALQNFDLLSVIYKNMATFYNAQGKYAEAEACISKALPYLSSEEDITSACSVKGDILSDMNRKDSAVYYWRIGKRSSNIYVKASSFHSLFQESKRMKDWQNATLYADSFILFYDSIETMNNRAELDSLMDNRIVELHKNELSDRNRHLVILLVVIFLLLLLLLVILYLWKDRCRKKKFMDLQYRLLDNRVETVLLNDNSTSPRKINSLELQRLKKERIEICMALFETTEGYKKLIELKKIMPKERIIKARFSRVIIVRDIQKTFVDVMGDLKDNCLSLTTDDLLYCVLVLLRCPKEVIMDVMDSSSDAIKTRKNRIKNKMNTDLFESIFNI